MGVGEPLRQTAAVLEGDTHLQEHCIGVLLQPERETQWPGEGVLRLTLPGSAPSTCVPRPAPARPPRGVSRDLAQLGGDRRAEQPRLN